jgi:alkylated DNA repair dioxygenase AlkB
VDLDSLNSLSFDPVKTTLTMNNGDDKPPIVINNGESVDLGGDTTIDLCVTTDNKLYVTVVDGCAPQSGTLERILCNPSDNHYVYVYRGFLSPEQSEHYYQVAEEHCTQIYTIMMHGKQIDQPRRNASFGENHNYNSIGTFQAQPWPAEIAELRDRVNNTFGLDMDSVLMNGYLDGTHYIGEHSDKNLQDKYQTICTVSVGATRRFVLKNKETKEKVETELHNGDLVLIWGDTNRDWTHQIPKQLRVKDPRYSYTFRKLKNTK